ncbi:MAG: hypothetical protein K8R77_03040, partial [Anaerolineaceae bacterium]|nr:hypothetical protein [Anaerolineaceae bacterium]
WAILTNSLSTKVYFITSASADAWVAIHASTGDPTSSTPVRMIGCFAITNFYPVECSFAAPFGDSTG